MASNAPSRGPTRSQTAASSDVGGSRAATSRTQTRQSSFAGAPHHRRGGNRKAKYRPMVTVARRRTMSRMSGAESAEPPHGPSRRDTLQDQLSTIDEDESDSESIITALTTEIPKPRYMYHPPINHYAAREMEIVTTYLQKTNVIAHILAINQGLLARGNLPYNPYPGFVNRMHYLAEGFRMHNKSDDFIRAKLQNNLQKTSTPVIWGVKGHTNVWGLKDIVHMVDYDAIDDYTWLLSTVFQTQLAQSEDLRGVKGDILVALTGPSVFTQTFYENPPSVNFNLEFVLYGTNLDLALRVFSRTLRDDVKQTVSSKCLHHFIGIQTMQPNGKMHLWGREQIEREKDEFFSAIEESTRLRHPPDMKGIFALDEKGKVYKKGSKKYIFHFILTDPDTGAESFISYADHPYSTLFTSVFPKKVHAEAYVTAFNRSLDPSGNGRATATTRQSTKSMTRRGRRDEPQVAPKGGNLTVMSEKVKAPVRDEWERELAGLGLGKGEISRIMHLLLLLALMDRQKYKLEEIIDIYRFLHSTANHFHIACAINPTLRLYIKLNDESKQAFASKVFLQYKRALLRVLDPSLHERSSDQEAAYEFLKRELDRVTVTQTNEDGSKVKLIPFTVQTQAQLLKISHYCESIQLALNEDTLPYVKHLNLKDLMSECKTKYPEEFSRPQTRIKEVQDKGKKKGSKPAAKKPPVILKHGVEASAIEQQKSMFVNVQLSLQTSMHPVVMATEGVLMQYLIDVKLDQVWRGFLMELMTADHLPPNPYPRLITRLRQATCKMSLWREADDKLRARLTHGHARLCDRANHIFEIEECGAYGLPSALSVVFPNSFDKLKKLANLMMNNDVVSHRGQFQISSCQAVSGHSPLYGRMLPYMPYLELHEHYYIRGPQGSNQSAIQLFAKLVYDHVADLCSTDKYMIKGLYVSGKLALSQDQLEEDEAQAERVITDATSDNSSVCLKLLHSVGWRYVPINKYYMMHYLYVDNAEDKYCAYFPDDPVYLYQNVFSSSDAAREHYKQSGASMNGNPMSSSNIATVNKSIDRSVRAVLDRRELLTVHKLLMTKALINKGSDYLSETWRMMHSVAYQLEYLMALAQTLVDIIRYVLQHPDAIETAEYAEEIAAAKAKSKKGATVPTKTFPVRAFILGYMITAFREKLEEVLTNPCAMSPRSLARQAGDKIREVVEKHPHTEETFLIINKQSILRLNEVHDLLLPLKVAIERDVHMSCSHIQDALKNI